MSLITAIKSFITPVKYYENNKFCVIKELLPNGSTSIVSFNKNGLLSKIIVKEPIDTFWHNENCGENILTTGHRTRLRDFTRGTTTIIDNVCKVCERPVHNTINTDGELIYSVDKLSLCHRVTKKTDGSMIDSFNMQKRNNGHRVCLKMSYDTLENPTNIKRYIVEA